MTKQSNFFQRIIAGIERQLANAGVRVTESVEIPEPTSGVPREVDVLIEGELNGHPVRIAVECRDHATPQDVTWIDELAGKYRDARISLVVAVSSSGFTKAAETKAANLGIRAIHFAEADNSEFPGLTIALFRQSNRLTGMTLKVNPRFDDPTRWKSPWTSPLFDSTGTQQNTLQGLIEPIYQGDMQALVKEKLSERATEIAKGGESVTVSISQDYSGGGLFFHAPDGKSHEIQEFTLKVEVAVETIRGTAKAYRYDRQRIVVGTAPLAAGQTVAITGLLGNAAGTMKLAHVEVASTASLFIRGH